jgi:hypothetical protein
MALLARFACGCTLRVEIPAPDRVRCAEHGAVAMLIQTPRGQVRYVSDQWPAVSGQNDDVDQEHH